MTLMKSLLLGSAAGIVAVASAQAADLPTRKGAPAVEYVKVCSITVGGKPIVGWTLPGSDTCFKIGGYLTGQIEGGNLKTPEFVDSYNYASGQSPGKGDAISAAHTTKPSLPGTVAHPSFGYTTRLNFAFDAVSNTAYGPLAAHAEMQFENGNGFDNTGNTSYINVAYVTWAGITAGKAPSFFSFVGGGDAWNNFFSPDQQGWNEPDLLAYTASFGGGFSATIAAQSAYGNTNGPGSNDADFAANICNSVDGVCNFVYNAERFPDVVANLKVAQGWGSAQISGVAHYVNVSGNASADAAGLFEHAAGLVQQTWGFAIDAGISFNLPSFGAGDEITFTGAYSDHAAWYSGIPDGMWGNEFGQVNYTNGQQMAIGDTYQNPNGTWADPTMWSVSSEITHHFSPYFIGSLEGSYGEVHWSNVQPGNGMVSDSSTWLAGVVAHWDPLGTSALDFEFELLYQYAHTDQPTGFVPDSSNPTWHPVGDGFAARFEVTRNF